MCSLPRLVANPRWSRDATSVRSRGAYRFDSNLGDDEKEGRRAEKETRKEEEKKELGRGGGRRRDMNLRSGARLCDQAVGQFELGGRRLVRRHSPRVRPISPYPPTLCRIVT